MEVVPIVIDALGTLSQTFEKRLEQDQGKRSTGFSASYAQIRYWRTLDTLGHGTWLDTNITMNKIVMIMTIAIILELQTKQNEK